MIERIMVAAGISLVVTLIAWLIFVIAALLDRVVPAWMPLVFCTGLFVVLFTVDLATTAKKDEE